MMSTWTCSCSAINPTSVTECEYCQRPRPIGSATTSPAPSLVCAWRGRHPCPVPATWYPRGGDQPGYCSWHALVARDPRIDVFDEFERLCRHHAQMYCGPFSHHSPSTLWDYIHGTRSELPPPAPCALASCRYAESV
jgi:hypothetical protein